MRTLRLCVSVLVLGACEGTGQSQAPDAETTGDAHVQIPVESMHDIMQAKLVHAHALLEGIAIQGYEQIELNAMDLTELSRTSDWQVHDTIAYGAFSEEFRQITVSLTESARERDFDALSRDYIRLIESCLRCHAYLREEGLYREMPGPVSMR